MKKLVLIIGIAGFLGLGIIDFSSAIEPLRKTVIKESPKRTLTADVPSKRTGIGFNSQLSNLGVDSLSIRYWTTKKVAIEALLGFSLGDNTIFNIGGKFLTVLKAEQNLNLYGFGIIGIENYDLGYASDTSFMAGGGFGVEFFLSGLDNLGFGTELGLIYKNINDNNQFGTSSGWLSSVGIRYYL
ncbi:MAG: hypothetical protein PHE88_11160 [Elusimicrobia bacterium]|nr:hypothetical protein [Elusimicrobiota bacterium]